MEGIFLGDRTGWAGEAAEEPSPFYCDRAYYEAAIYRLVKLGHYTAAQLEDPQAMPVEFAALLLRADNAWHAAEAEQRHRNAPKD